MGGGGHWLYSKPWSLPTNQSYPISCWIDRNQQYRGRAATSSQNYAVITFESDQAVYDELKAGNAAKAKTDTLGKLIAKRQEAEVK